MVHRNAYAVLDFETTGFGSTDRVIEIGVVLLDADLQVESTWETLVQPNRDIPNTFIHKISASDVKRAPYFDQIAATFAGLLTGRTLVAHNANFELRFLTNEFNRLGLAWPAYGNWIVDTQRLTKQILPEASLEKSLVAAGIRNERPHSALADAAATAELLQFLAASEPSLSLATGVLELPPTKFPAPLPPVPRAGSRTNRFAQLAEQLPQPGTAPERHYRDLLSEALDDKELAPAELAELNKTATAHGLSAADVQTIHEEFVHQLAIEAWMDGVITAEERRTLHTLAQNLKIDAQLVDNLLSENNAPRIVLEPGDRITLTGTMELGRDEWTSRIIAAGLTVGGIAKTTKVLVAANPDSMSGKAKKARDFGIPIVGEAGLAQLLRTLVEQDETPEPDLTVNEAPTAYHKLFPWLSDLPSPLPELSESAITSLWIEHFPQRPLHTISPTRKVDSPIDLGMPGSSVRAMLEAYSSILGATAEELSDIRGIGALKLNRIVSAVVAAALDSEEIIEAPGLGEEFYEEPEANIYSEDVALAVGWMHLTSGASPERALTSMPQKLRDKTAELHEALTSSLNALFAEAVYELTTLTQNDPRLLSIIDNRWLKGATLDELGQEFGITRERIRQLESQLKKDFAAQAELFHAVVRKISGYVAPIVGVEYLRHQLPALTQQAVPFSCSYGELFSALGQQWVITDGWAMQPGYDETIHTALQEAANEYKVADRNDVRSTLHLSKKVFEEYLARTLDQKVIAIGDKLIVGANSHQDRAVALLSILGKRLTAEEIQEHLGSFNYRSASNQYSTDERMVKVSNDQWALREWGLPEFRTISEWISERVDEEATLAAQTGEPPRGVSLKYLLDHAEELRISENSIRAYAGSDGLEIVDGMVKRSEAAAPEPIGGSIEESRDVYYFDGQWHLLLTVTYDHLRGSGFQIPRGIANYYGLHAGETLELTSELGEQYIRVNKLKQVNCSTARRFFQELELAEGDRAWLRFGEDKSFAVLRAPDFEEGLDGFARLYNLMGIEQRPADGADDADVAELLQPINEVLGLSATAPRRRTVARLRHRNQEDLAEEIQGL